MSRFLCLLPLLLLLACGDQAPVDQAATPPADQAPAASGDPVGAASEQRASSSSSHPLQAVLLPDKPADAKSITAVKAAPTAGERVVVWGRIGGRKNPFVPGKAAVVLADDEAIVACDASPDDHCSAPWDYCCEDKAKIAAATCLLVVHDEQGAPAATDLAGLGGLKPGSYVVVDAEIGPDSSPENLVLIAKGIHVDTERTVRMRE